MGACALQAADKRLIARRVGRDLIGHHGKRRSYTILQVKDAALRQGFAVDWHCWAYALYTDRSSFDVYHRAMGERCDYGTMHQSMMDVVGGDAVSTLEVLDPSSCNTSVETVDDSSSIFDFFDWSDVDVDDELR